MTDSSQFKKNTGNTKPVPVFVYPKNKVGDPVKSKIHIDKWSAYRDLTFWAKNVKSDIDVINSLLSNPEDKSASSTNNYSEIDRYCDIFLNDMLHFYKALRNPQFNKSLKKLVKEHLDIRLEEELTHIRNIRYHWEKTRNYFEGVKPKENKQNKSVRWFMDKYPDISPFSIVSGFSREHGKILPTRIAGVIIPESYKSEVEKLMKIARDNTKETDLGIVKVRL